MEGSRYPHFTSTYFLKDLFLFYYSSDVCEDPQVCMRFLTTDYPSRPRHFLYGNWSLCIFSEVYHFYVILQLSVRSLNLFLMYIVQVYLLGDVSPSPSSLYSSTLPAVSFFVTSLTPTSLHVYFQSYRFEFWSLL